MEEDFYFSQHSISEIVQSTYPEHDWLIWKFRRVPNGFWNDKKNQRNCLDWIGKQLGIKDMEDWYKMSARDILEHGGIRITKSVRIFAFQIANVSLSRTYMGYTHVSQCTKRILANQGESQKIFELARKQAWTQINGRLVQNHTEKFER